MTRVVITGLGIIAPNGNSIPAFMQSLKSGKSGIRYIEKLRELQFSCQIGGIPQNLEDLRNATFTEEERRTMNESLSLAVLAAKECWEDGGFLFPAMYTDEDTGAIIGIGICGMDTIANTIIPMIDMGKVKRMGSSMVENVMASGPSARICNFLGLGGTVTTNSSACVTGSEAIAEAYFKIQQGRVKRMLAGGVESSSHYIWGSFDAMRVLAKNYNQDPERGSRPLSQTAEGFVPSSGAGILMLEELETARKRGARIYAELIGAEVNSGGQREGGSMTAPGSKGVVRCIRKALVRARIHPHQIDLINGHLTGTIADKPEVRNWQMALELNTSEMPFIQATKSLIGHALGAAGTIECIASVLQIYHGFIHGTINTEDLHPEIIPMRDKIVQKTIEHPIDIVAKAGFGFGDVNCCLIFKKWKES